MKKFLCLLITAALTVLLGICSFADDLYNVDDTGTLTFSTTVDMSALDKINQNISSFDDYRKSIIAVMFKPNMLENRDSMNGSNLSDYIVGFTNTSLDDDGAYTVEIHMKGESGTYKLVVANPVLGEQIYDIEYESKFFIDYNMLLQLANESNMQDFLAQNAAAIHFDKIGYDVLDSSEQTEILNQIMNAQAVKSDAELQACMEALPIAQRVFQTAATADVISAYVSAVREQPFSIFCNDVTKYLFENFNTDEINNIFGTYVGSTAAMDETFLKTFAFNVFKHKCSEFSYSMQMQSLLSSAIWGFDQSDIAAYNALDDATSVNSGMKDGVSDVSDFDAYSALFKKLIASARTIDIETPSRPSVSSGGGGNVGGKSKVGIYGESVLTDTKPNTPIEPDIQNTNTFLDLGNYDWAKESINVLVKNNVVSGYSDTEYRPGSFITREEFVKLLTQGLRLTGAEADVSYGDVSQTDWFYKAIAAATRAEIAKGDENGNFGIGQRITRQDMAVMLMRAAEHKNYRWTKTASDVRFTDSADVAEYASTAVSMLAAEGFINGMDDSTFKPQNFLTRAEAAVVLHRFLDAVDMIR